MPTILQLDLQQIIAQAISFLLLVWVLKRFAWRPLLAILDARRQRIEDGFRELAKGQDDLERLQHELTRRLATIEEEARVKIQQAVLEGKRVAIDIQEQARAQARDIVAKSKETLALELAKARVSLRDDLADMTVEALERLLKGKVDADVDKAVVAAILEELGEASASR